MEWWQYVVLIVGWFVATWLAGEFRSHMQHRRKLAKLRKLQAAADAEVAQVMDELQKIYDEYNA